MSEILPEIQRGALQKAVGPGLGPNGTAGPNKAIEVIVAIRGEREWRRGVFCGPALAPSPGQTQNWGRGHYHNMTLH